MVLGHICEILVFGVKFINRILCSAGKSGKVKHVVLTLLAVSIFAIFILNKSQPSYPSSKLPRIELTIRLALSKKLLERFFCDFLRSTALFWNSNYGDVLLILDNEDKRKKFESTLKSIGLPIKFRLAYEKDLIRHGYI